ncbi:MAG: hypothetical protein WC867_04395 [Candidatus Pacearchaeota archaeon]
MVNIENLADLLSKEEERLIFKLEEAVGDPHQDIREKLQENLLGIKIKEYTLKGGYAKNNEVYAILEDPCGIYKVFYVGKMPIEYSIEENIPEQEKGFGITLNK